jgi:UDP-2,3-diacylglucosamine pyrophosphatase LpxH
VNFISDFEQILADEARRRGFDGVICGHIHKAEVKDIGGVVYGNCGDWVESLSALVEHTDGRLEVVYWTSQASAAAAPATIAAQPVREGTLEEAETCAS